ncbi:MAG: hypothetical protein CMF59_15815 [Leptospiraceae bacterium]|nr:hypothetical protein [Leptospiraceae bacterium]
MLVRRFILSRFRIVCDAGVSQSIDPGYGAIEAYYIPGQIIFYSRAFPGTYLLDEPSIIILILKRILPVLPDV